MEQLRVLVVDRRELFSRALVDALPEGCVGATARPDDIPQLHQLLRQEWDVVVVEAGAASSVRHAVGRLLLLTPHRPTTSEAADLVRSGAAGICTEDDSLEDVVEAVLQVGNAHLRLPRDLAQGVVSELSAPVRDTASLQARASLLTPRERDVLRLLTQGLGRNEIARRMTLSPHTIRTHVQHILEKLDVHSQLEASAAGRALFGSEHHAATVIHLEPARDAQSAHH